MHFDRKISKEERDSKLKYIWLLEIQIFLVKKCLSYILILANYEILIFISYKKIESMYFLYRMPKIQVILRIKRYLYSKSLILNSSLFHHAIEG